MHRIQFAEHPSPVLGGDPTCCCHLHPAWTSFQQGLADPRFQQGEVLTHGWLSKAKRAGRTGERSGVYCGDEAFQM